MLQPNRSCDVCGSYFFPGSLIGAEFSLKPIAPNAKVDVVSVSNAVGLKIDFTDVDPREPAFSLDSDCVVLGDNKAAVAMCARSSVMNSEELVVG